MNKNAKLNNITTINAQQHVFAPAFNHGKKEKNHQNSFSI